MKRTILISALALSTLAGAASAATSADTAILDRYAPNIDVSTLTNAQVSTLLNITSSGDSEGVQRALIQHLVK
ncbi:hypothetical protein [Puniceibacterium sediminis]|uniref:Uncharacterized protein n=1 Tax=Puniceibacterium sediminis TaxID=1608407 RepID=A0A238VH39_9RHOB|nr:hypothetical protein [Puniceibacterium sediminis]SNR33722.1 hypothetical protein SAMN06265370_102173 [Puniceibacterium sediminis]